MTPAGPADDVRVGHDGAAPRGAVTEGSADPGAARPDRLGPEWVLGDDGLRFRRGARVILLDPSDRVLLLRGHDVDDPARSWWFTVGGGIDPGEGEREAAAREVREEVGVALEPAALVGPVLTRSAVFDFYAEHCRQDEVFFVARVDAIDAAALDRAAWTDVERESLLEARWWPLDELAAAEATTEVFPAGLADLVRPLLRGWDGVTRDLGRQPG